MRINGIIIGSLLLLFGLTALVRGDEFRWQQIGPEGGSVSSLAQSRINRNEVYASINSFPGSIFKSTDFGQSWERFSVIEGYSHGIALDPVDPETIYISSGNSIFKSTDGGVVWNEYIFSLTDTFSVGCDPVIDPVNRGNIYAAGQCITPDSLFRMVFLKSTDGGADWEYSFFGTVYDSADATALAVDPQNPQILYLGGFSVENYNQTVSLMKSTDGGGSWFDITGNIEYVPTAIIVDSGNSDRVNVGTGMQFYWSTNGGSDWNNSTAYISKMAVDYDNPNIFYAVCYGTFCKSTDYGVTWELSTPGLEGEPAGIVVYDSTRLVYGSGEGFFVTSDAGTNWELNNTGLYAADVPSMAVILPDPDIIYCYAGATRLLKTTDHGASWTKLEGPMLIQNYDFLKTSRYNEDEVYLLGGP